MANPYVRWWDANNEQNLLQKLMTEAIRFHAFEVVYLPRSLQRFDTLLNEDILSQFTETYRIDTYIQDTGGWGGTGDFLTKFGMKVNDQVNLMISRETFIDLIPEQSRPMEGDWIYFPLPLDALFEIKHVEHEKSAGQFYPLGVLTYYDVRCEIHMYQHERIRTGDPDIDELEFLQAYALDVPVAGGSGEYVIGETVVQGPSVNEATATGVVGAWDDGVLRLASVTGTFAAGLPVWGVTSGTTWTVASPPDPLELPNDKMDDNRYLENLEPDLFDSSDPYQF